MPIVWPLEVGQRAARAAAHAEVEPTFVVPEGRRVLVPASVVLRRDVDETRLGVERHRLPVVAAERARPNLHAFLFVAGAVDVDRPAGLHVDPFGPGHGHVALGRQKLAGLAVEHVEEAVLRRLHDHFARSAVDLEVGQDHLLRRREVPALAGRRLVVPDQRAVVGIEGNDRRQVEVVAAARAAVQPVPGRAVAGADVDQIELGIVGERVPHRAPTPGFPRCVRAPGFRRPLHRLGIDRMLRLVGRLELARHRVEAPHQFARLGLVCRDIATHAVLGAAVADDDVALGDARRAGDRVGLFLIDRDDFPHRLAGVGIERDQPAVEHAHEDLPLVHGDAPVHHVAAGQAVVGLVDPGVVTPQPLAGGRIEGEDDAPRTGRVHDTVDDDRGGLEATIGAGVEAPGKPQIGDVVRVDLIERAEALLEVGSAVDAPVAGVGIGGLSLRRGPGVDLAR